MILRALPALQTSIPPRPPASFSVESCVLFCGFTVESCPPESLEGVLLAGLEEGVSFDLVWRQLEAGFFQWGLQFLILSNDRLCGSSSVFSIAKKLTLVLLSQ